MKNVLAQMQEDTVANVDTLTQSYSQKWDAAGDLAQSGWFIQTAASYDLIFIVMAVSLVIWLVLLFFIVRVDKKVTKLEEEIEQQNTPKE